MMRTIRKPILQAPETKKYDVHVLEEICDACRLCEEFCPKDVLAKGESFNSRMLHYTIVVNADDCTGCLQCERLCPSVAIFVRERIN